MYKLEKVQQRTTRMNKGLEHLSYKEQLRVWKREGSEDISYMCINIWKDGPKKIQPGSFWWCLVTGQEAMGKNWNMRNSISMSGNTFLLLWGWISTGTSCWESLYNLSDIFKSHLDTVLGNCLYMEKLGQEVLEQMTSRGPYQHQPFCDSVNSSFFIIQIIFCIFLSS